MIDFGTSTIKRICARAQELFRDSERKPNFCPQESSVWRSVERARSPQAPHFTPDDIELLHCLRQQLSRELGPDRTITDREVLYFALRELERSLRSARREDEVLRLRFQLWDAKSRRG